LGEIKPVWQRVGEGAVAGWAEAGSGNAFVDSARLMELERQMDGDETKIVMLDQVATEALASGMQASLAGRLVRTGAELAGKHRRVYRVAAYAPRPREQAVLEAESSSGRPQIRIAN
jgi:hypothetical protein